MAERFTTVLFSLLLSLAIPMFSACSVDSGGGGGFSPDFIKDVTGAFETSVKSNGFPGGVLGLMRASDGAKMLAATGMAEPVSTADLDQKSWTAKTLMSTGAHTRIASVSKPFTAIMILMLIDDGILSLDQTIEDFFLALVPNSAIITIRNLLNMTSGLYDHEYYLPLEEATFCGDLTIYYTPEELIAMSNALGGGGFLFNPGEYYNYTNTNFTILAMIAQKATGQTYKELITNLIITRLGLTGTVVPGDYETTMPSSYVHGYDIPAGKAEDICSDYTSWRDYSIQNMSWDLGAGSIISTAQDLLQFMKAIATGELISAELKDQMLTPPEVNYYGSGTLSSYGFGINVTESGFMYHEGANFGYNTIMCYWDGYYYAILVNAGVHVTSGGEVKTTEVLNILLDVKKAVLQ